MPETARIRKAALEALGLGRNAPSGHDHDLGTDAGPGDPEPRFSPCGRHPALCTEECVPSSGDQLTLTTRGQSAHPGSLTGPGPDCLSILRRGGGALTSALEVCRI